MVEDVVSTNVSSKDTLIITKIIALKRRPAL